MAEAETTLLATETLEDEAPEILADLLNELKAACEHANLNPRLHLSPILKRWLKRCIGVCKEDADGLTEVSPPMLQAALGTVRMMIEQFGFELEVIEEIADDRAREGLSRLPEPMRAPPPLPNVVPEPAVPPTGTPYPYPGTSTYPYTIITTTGTGTSVTITQDPALWSNGACTNATCAAGAPVFTAFYDNAGNTMTLSPFIWPPKKKWVNGVWV